MGYKTARQNRDATADSILAACIECAQRVSSPVEFEWDPSKHESNLRTRGIGLDEAALIFEGVVIEWPDTRSDYGEVRMNAIGEANGKVLRVTYTMRGQVVRIITAWKANQKDRQRWQAGS